jgi:hypothetical protein
MACNSSSCLPTTNADLYFVPAELTALIGNEATTSINGGQSTAIKQDDSSLESTYGLTKPKLDTPLGQ